MPGETSVAARASDASSQSSSAANNNNTNNATNSTNNATSKSLPTDMSAIPQSSELGDNTMLTLNGDFGPNVTLVGGLNSTQRPSVRVKKIGHRRVDESGQVFYKRTPTQELMETIQLGIYTSLAFAEKMGQHDLLYRDFKRIEILDFPSEGGGEPPTPAHRFADFKFRSYAPTAFRHFRSAFQIEPTDFMRSLCDDALRELSNPGASGSVFYLTADDNFIIKTVQHNEADFLLKLLPGYYMNLTQNPRTLLPKFYGLFTYQSRGKNIRFIIMNNLLPSNVTFHEKYDLKGSTFKRQASRKEREKKIPTLKDLDFIEENPDGISLDAEKYEALRMTIERDCRVLESFKIMDYSLLLGIHNHTLACQQAVTSTPATVQTANTMPPTVSATPHVPLNPEGSGGLGAVAGSTVAALVGGVTAMSARLQPAFHTAMEAIQGAGRLSSTDASNSMVIPQAESDPNFQDSNTAQTRVNDIRHYQTPGIQMPLTPTTSGQQVVCDHRGGIPAHNAKGDQLYLYVGIIDILQDYRLKKKLEHAFKAIVYDGETVSVCRPSFYSNRFQQFMMNKVFRKGPSARQRFRSIVHLAIKIHSKDSVKRKTGQSAKRQGVLTNRPDLLPPNADVFVRDLSPPAISGYSNANNISNNNNNMIITGGNNNTNTTKQPDETLANTTAHATSSGIGGMSVTFSDDTVNTTFNNAPGHVSTTSSYATATSTTPTSFRNKSRVTSENSSLISADSGTTVQQQQQQPSVAVLPASPSPPPVETLPSEISMPSSQESAPIASPESISIDFMKPVVVSASMSSFSASSNLTVTRAGTHDKDDTSEDSKSIGDS